MEGKPDDGPGVLAAYDEVCRSYETIDDFRAKLLGLLPVVSGAGLFLLLGNEAAVDGDCSNPGLFAIAGSFGAIVTVGLLCYEERGFQRCIRLVTVGQMLESRMKVEGRFKQWPHSWGRIVNEAFASGLIYSALFSAWVYVALMCSWPTAAIVAAVGALWGGFLVTRAFYWWVTWVKSHYGDPLGLSLGGIGGIGDTTTGMRSAEATRR
jgi:hypothetical protein